MLEFLANIYIRSSAKIGCNKAVSMYSIEQRRYYTFITDKSESRTKYTLKENVFCTYYSLYKIYAATCECNESNKRNDSKSL